MIALFKLSFWFIADSLHGLLHWVALSWDTGYWCTCWANLVPSIFLQQQKSQSPNISKSARLVNVSMKYQKVSVFPFLVPIYDFVRHPFLYLVDQWIFPVLVRGAQGSIESPNLAIYTSVNAGILPIRNLKNPFTCGLPWDLGPCSHAQQH